MRWGGEFRGAEERTNTDRHGLTTDAQAEALFLSSLSVCVRPCSSVFPFYPSSHHPPTRIDTAEKVASST